jgi:hypothetical protein
MPKTPTKATEPDTAEGGGSTQATPLTGEPGKYDLGSQKVQGGQSGASENGADDSPPVETYSIIIELQNDQNKAVSALPNGGSVKFLIKVGKKTYEGQLDGQGKARIDGLPEKTCKVSFPEIHEKEWNKK